MATTPMNLFVMLSSAVCGIAMDKLAPNIDPTDVKQAYFETAQKQTSVAFAQLLNIVDRNASLSPDQLADLVLNKSGDDIRFLVRSIMLAWYLGSWYQPTDLAKYAGPNPPTIPIDFFVISTNAYTQGWVWNTAQAHPMGYSTLTFGYWGALPPSLTDYIGN